MSVFVRFNITNDKDVEYFLWANTSNTNYLIKGDGTDVFPMWLDMYG